MELSKTGVSNRLYNETILYIPVISSINRQTGKYNLDSDGNVVRFITFFENHKLRFTELYDMLIVVLPSNNESHEIVSKWVRSNNNIYIVWSDDFGIHAGEQRNNPDVYNAMLHNIDMMIEDNYGITTIIYESQGLGNALISDVDSKYNDVNLVYWCPVCKIDDSHTRNFLEGYDELNEKLFDSSCWSIVESPAQLNKFSSPSNFVYPYYKMSDRNLKYFDYEKNDALIKEIENYANEHNSVYYLPYRLTDDGYKIEDVISYINFDISEHTIVYYTDPNNSGYMDSIKNKFDANVRLVNISTDRNTHFTMLSSEHVIIPYFEDLDFINHAMLWEMMSDKSNCQFCVTKEQWDLNPYNLKSIDRCFYIDKEDLH